MGTVRADTYAFRSALSPAMVHAQNIFTPAAEDFAPPAWLRTMMNQHLRLRPYFSGDFYPLQSYSLDNEAWAAWQFHRPDLDEGCVIAFRRPHSPVIAITARLQGLAADASYALEDLDDGTIEQSTGARTGPSHVMGIRKRTSHVRSDSGHPSRTLSAT